MWLAVFSCGLGMHFCTCMEVYLAQHFFGSLVCRVLLGFSHPPFPPGSVSFLLSFGVGVWVRVGVSALSYLVSQNIIIDNFQ